MEPESLPKPLKFHYQLPPAHDFVRFSYLPYDLREIIWNDIIQGAPGIHFLCFRDPFFVYQDHAGELARLTGIDSEKGWSHHVRTIVENSALPSQFSSILTPYSLNPFTDESYWVARQKTLVRLSASSREARFLIEKAIAKPGNLRLFNGQLVHLESTEDVVWIEYPFAMMLGSLNIKPWARHLDLDQLAKIRRVAVPYESAWDYLYGPKSNGETFPVLSDEQPRPDWARHRHHNDWQFAALFRNLEAFYFVRERPFALTGHFKEDGNTSPATAKERYRTAIKEVSLCTVEDKDVAKNHATLISIFRNWVKEQYRAECERNPSLHKAPKDVRFEILVARWDEKEVDSTGHEALKRSKPSAVHNKKTKSEQAGLSSSQEKTSAHVSANPVYAGHLPVVFGDGGKSHFDFTFKVPE
ncbi:hypothetical protein F4778DRAFT_783602 [Xylariomycetidae sp. FL2044]|nr:hypothetical protein F4778DRAFT_783602 [Xylariomycetidae sp. FL2044]